MLAAPAAAKTAGGDEKVAAAAAAAGSGGGAKKPAAKRAKVDVKTALSKLTKIIQVSRRRDCHFTGIPSPVILKHLLKREGGAAE